MTPSLKIKLHKSYAMSKQYLSTSSNNPIAIFLVLGLLFLTNTSQSQSFWDDVMIIGHASIAEDDNRLFNWSGSVREYMEESSRGVMGNLGTRRFGISIQKQWLQFERLSFSTGVGYGFEHQTFKRVIDHCYFLQKNSICYSMFPPRVSDYKIHMIQIPVNISVKIISGLNLSFKVNPLFDFYKNSGRVSHVELNFYSLEINPGLEYEWDQFKFGIHYRLWQLKRIDPVYISSRLSGTNELSLVDQSFEQYNPVKVGVSFGYRIGK